VAGLAGLALATAAPPGERGAPARPAAAPAEASGSRPRGAASADPRAVDDRLGDIQSLYAWMDADATHLNLVMTVSPFDDGTTAFGPGFQYVFHVGVHDSLGSPSLKEDVLILCQFPGATEIECWVGNTYLRGTPSLTDGLYSDNRMVRVFAGRRSDPFFFNGAGFENARAQLRTYLPPPGQVRCPQIPAAEAAAIRAKLRTPPTDRFADTNVLALVLTIDKRSLGILSSIPLLSVWGSTHRQ
jgi:hypothetical protein